MTESDSEKPEAVGVRPGCKFITELPDNIAAMRVEGNVLIVTLDDGRVVEFPQGWIEA